MKEGKVDTNPFKSLKKPKKPSRLPQFIEESQSIQIYSDDTNNLEWDGFRSYAIVRVLYETGIRRAELIGLRWNDISNNRKLIRVVGKRNKTREVPISDGMIEFLKIYREKQNTFLLENQKEKISEHVFLNDKGEAISVTKLYHSVREVLSQWTTMRKRSPHILRHSFATHMLNGGADLNVIKEILGHGSLSATQVYTHVNIAKLKGLHSKLHPRSDEK
jgi:integrase/recombinase XerC